MAVSGAREELALSRALVVTLRFQGPALPSRDAADLELQGPELALIAALARRPPAPLAALSDAPDTELAVATPLLLRPSAVGFECLDHDVPRLVSFGPASGVVEDPRAVRTRGVGHRIEEFFHGDWELESPVSRALLGEHLVV